MKFNLVKYIKRNLINGYKDGTWTESKVAQLAISYMDKEHITLEDVADIDAQIQAINAEREAIAKEAEKELLESDENDIVNNPSNEDNEAESH